MPSSSNSDSQKLSRGALVALVVGSMVGSGIFALPSSFGRATGALGAMIAWGIAGAGMLMLAFVFQTLSRRKPDLDSGIYAYAKAGFGDYPGFASAVGYWIGCCLADVACLVLIKATLGQFFAVFGDGTTPTEVLHSAAANGTMPTFLARENARGVPAAALWLTNIVIQVFLLVSYFAEYAFTLALKMTSSMTLVPYLLVAAYGLKLAWTGETYAADSRSRAVDWIRSAIATIYAAGMIYAGGAKFLLLSALLYAPGTALFVIARREQKAAFTLVDGLLFGAICIAAAVGLYSLLTGSISI